MSKSYTMGIDDVRSIVVEFANGESIFIRRKFLNLLDIHLMNPGYDPNDPVIKYSFTFDKANISIDKEFLKKMLGANLFERLNYRGNVSCIIVEYFNEGYKIKDEVPMMLCVARYDTMTSYQEDKDSFIIKVNLPSF